MTCLELNFGAVKSNYYLIAIIDRGFCSFRRLILKTIYHYKINIEILKILVYTYNYSRGPNCGTQLYISHKTNLRVRFLGDIRNNESYSKLFDINRYHDLY